jgi:hypothetical protein
MKRALQALLALSFATIFIVSPVAAATSQGLEWGISAGQQWNYDITTVADGVTEIDDTMYFEVTGVDTIPNILTDWDSIPKPEFDITWDNGTALGWTALIFLLYFYVTDTWAVPIGNYTLLGELYEAHPFYNGTIYNSGIYWGMDLTDDSFGSIVTIHIDFLKDDGLLAHWNVVTDNGTLHMIRVGLPRFDIVGMIQDNILLIGAGGVIVVLLAVICMRRR